MSDTAERLLRPLLLGPVLLALAGGCAAPPEVAPARHVILVSIDTLRRDHLGCYGYHRPTTPHIDAFRRDAAVFAQAITQAPSTLMSHSSVFTSLLPPHHGASASRFAPLPESATTVAEVFRDRGFATAAFHGGGRLAREFGLGQGFDEYREVSGPFRGTAYHAVVWLDQHRDEPFFLFLHTYQVHAPYTPSDNPFAPPSDLSRPLPQAATMDYLEAVNRGDIRLSDREVANVVSLYDAEIRIVDQVFGDFVQELKKRHLYRDATIVLIADHGEELGDHGKVGWHSHTLYDELLRVPLIVKLPGNALAGQRYSGQVRLIDVAPTLLATAGQPTPPVFEGADLLQRLISGPRDDLPAVSFVDRERLHLSIRYRGWKLYDRRLFDLHRDPGETTDRAAANPDRMASLEALLREQLEQRPEVTSSPVPIEEDTARQLRALGYLD